LKIKYPSIAIFAVGLLLGALAQYGISQLFLSQTEKTWHSHNTDSSHARITALQDAMAKLGAPTDANALTQQIDLQQKIEDLIVQSRAAEYANLAPFTSLSSSAGGFLIALLGFIAGLIGKKRGAADSPTS